MPKRKPIRLEKQRHEVGRYLRSIQASLVTASQSFGFRLCPMSLDIHGDETGYLFVPSRHTFERLHPRSRPTGLVFPDTSFLCIKEVVRYDYRHEQDHDPALFRLSYGYHYQRPPDRYYFRFDHHPETGVDFLHPEFHMHSRGWQDTDAQLPARPRIETKPVDIDFILKLIVENFFNPSVKS